MSSSDVDNACVGSSTAVHEAASGLARTVTMLRMATHCCRLASEGGDRFWPMPETWKAATQLQTYATEQVGLAATHLRQITERLDRALIESRKSHPFIE